MIYSLADESRLLFYLYVRIMRFSSSYCFLVNISICFDEKIDNMPKTAYNTEVENESYSYQIRWVAL
jgi:hypothetical protein